MNMIYIAIALFAVSAVLGLIILISWLKSRAASKAVIYSHGIFAAVALLITIVFAAQHPDHFPIVSLVLFLLAALVGFYMFFQDLKNKMSPMALAIAHALVAVCGFVALLFFALG